MRNHLKKILVILSSLILSLCMIEGLLRLMPFSAIQDEKYFFGFYGAPPYFQEVQIGDCFYYKTNPDKDIQDNCFPVIKSDNTFRIFILGGSVAYGKAFGATGSFAFWMQKRLETYYPKKKFEIINCARRGFGSCRVKNIFDEIISYNPDCIILFLGNNEARDDRFHRNEINIEIRPHLKKIKHVLDHSYLFRRLFQITLKKRITSFGQEVLSAILKPDVFNPRLFQSQADYIHSIRSIMDRQYGGEWISTLKPSDIDDRVKMEPYLQKLNHGDLWHPKFKSIFLLNMHHIADECRDKHISLLFLGRARNFYYNRDARLLFDHYDDTNQVLKSFSERRNIPLVDLLSVLTSLNNQEIGYNLFLDIIHPNLYGNQIIARATVSRLMELKWLDNIPDSSLRLLKNQVNLREQNALSSYPYNANYYISIGWQKLVCLEAANDRASAEQDIITLSRNALELDPKNMEAYLLLATYYIMSGNNVKAEQIWHEMKLNLAN